MGYVSSLIKVASGAGAGIAVVTALPVFGAVGAITATGIAVGSIVGAVAGVADELKENDIKLTQEIGTGLSKIKSPIGST